MRTQQPDTGKTVVTAKRTRKWGTFWHLTPMWLACGWVVLFLMSVSVFLLLTVYLLVGALIVVLIVRFSGQCELVFDDEGACLQSTRRGLLTATPTRFRWDEVERVSRSIFTARGFLTIHLSRGRDSRASRGRPARTLRWPPALWEDDRFIQALRRNVPAERISPNALEADWAPLWLNPTLGAFLLLCAAGVATSALLALSESPISGYYCAWAVYISCFLGYVASFCAFDAESPVCGVVGGALLGWGLVQLPLFALALVGSGSRVLVAGWLAAAALLLGGAVLVLMGRRARWHDGALFYALGVAGLVAGWGVYDGIPSTRVGEGDVILYSWTVNGDGFVTQRLLEDAEETALQWYSADGESERAVTLPATGFVCAVGRDVALFLVRGENEGQVYALPRRAGGLRLLASAYAVADVRVSPNGRRCVVATREEDGGPLLVATLALPDGEIEEFSLPPGHEDAENVGILDDGRLVWTIGERPIRPDGGRMSHDAEIPPREMWPSIEERVDVWAWHPQREAEPAWIYDAQQVWLDWRMSPTSGRLFVCRVIEDPSPRREFVAALLAAGAVEIRPSRRERFWSSNPLSPDGRFTVKDVEGTFPVQTRVYDAETGETRRLRETALFGMDRLLWSPAGHRFLYNTLDRPVFRLRWKGTIADDADDARWVVRLVDLGE